MTEINDNLLADDVNFFDEDLAIEQGALVPSTYTTRGAPLKTDVVCVEMSDEVNTFVDENGKAYAERARAKKAFEDYINLGPTRTLQKLAEIYSQSDVQEWTNNVESVLRILKNYSARFDWQNRLRMLLTNEAAGAIHAARTEAAKSQRGRIAQAKKLQTLGSRLIDRASTYLDANLEEMSPKDVNTLLKTSVAMLDIGLAAERVEIGGVMDDLIPAKPVATMDDNELAEFIKVLSAKVK